MWNHRAEPSSRALVFHLINHSFSLFVKPPLMLTEWDMNEGNCAARWTGSPLSMLWTLLYLAGVVGSQQTVWRRMYWIGPGRLGWLPVRESPSGQRKEQANSWCTDYRLRVLPWPFGIAREKEKFQIKTYWTSSRCYISFPSQLLQI